MTEPVDVALVVGIGEYDDPALAPLPEVEQETALIRAGLAGAGFVTPPPLIGRHPLAAVLAYLSQASASTRRVVVYWTGHGAAGPDGHWLFTSDSHAAAPEEESAMSAARLTACLESIPHASQVVAILDSCGAGATAAQVARAVNDAPRQRPQPGRRPVALSIISATYDEANALPLAFARSLAAALRDGPPWTMWPTQLPVIAPQDLARAADGWLRENGAPEAQRVRCTGVEAGTGFFTNPQHLPNARDVVLGGSAFVERRGVLDAIRGWADSSQGGLFLLTGSPGTGKSAVVAQLAEPAGTSGPRARGVVLINLAGGTTLSGLLESLAPRAGAPGVGTPEELVAALRDSGRRVIVVDSLEEADPVDRRQIVQRILLPLSAVPGIHVVAAARGGAGDVPGSDVGLLRQSASGLFNLDADPDAEEDIARHVSRTLTGTPNSPYRDDPGLVRAVAAEVAKASGGIFLIASTVAAALARSPHAVGTADPMLQDALRAGIGGAMTADLARFGARRETVVAALAPLAWIHGPGVPARPVWVRLARALAIGGTERISDETIDWVIANAGFYLTPSSADGALVYRLRHQSFADYLRTGNGTGPPGDARSVHRKIVAALRPEPGGWPAADPYVRRYLPVHAEQAGQVASLFDDPDVMAWADPAALADVASRVPAGSRGVALNLYLRAGPRLERLDPPMRGFVLQSLAAEETPGNGAKPRATLRFSVPAPCTTLWTSAPAAAPHRLLRAGTESLESLAVLPADGRYLLATAERAWGRRDRSAPGIVELFDPESTAPAQRLVALTGDGVEAMVHAPAPGDQLLVSAHRNNVLEAWSLRRRAPLWSQDTSRPILRCQLLRSRGEYLVATSGGGGPAHIWHSVTGAFLRSVEPSGDTIFMVWFTVDDRNRLCLGTNTGLLSLFDADTFEPLGDVEPEVIWIAAGFATVRGQPTLIGARQDGRLETRHARDGRLLAVSRDESENIAELLCVVDGPSGRPVVATADDSVIVLWTTAPLERARFLAGHTDDVTAFGVLPGSNGLNALVSASDDGTVRAWPPFDGLRRDFGSPPDVTAYSSPVRRTELDGRAVLLAKELMGVAVVDAESGAPIRSFTVPMMTTRDPDYARPDIRGVVARGADAMVLTYHDGGAQRMWSLTSGKQYALPTGRFDPNAARVTVVGAQASALLVIGDGVRPVASFDPSGALGATLAGSDGALPGPVLAGLEDQILLYKAGWLAGYDARTGAKLAEIVLPHSDGVPRAAAADRRGAWVVYGTRDAIWLAQLGHPDGGPGAEDGAPVHLLDRYVCHAAAVMCGGRSYAAVSDEDQLLLIRPADGSVALRVPFIGNVWDVVATGPGRLCVAAGGRLVHVQIAIAGEDSPPGPAGRAPSVASRH